MSLGLGLCTRYMYLHTVNRGKPMDVSRPLRLRRMMICDSSTLTLFIWL